MKSKEAVEEFLQQMKQKIELSIDNVIIVQKFSDKPDKTAIFRAEHNISTERICEALLQLDVSNYSYTDDDYDLKKKGEVWIFGQFMFFSSKPFEVYIKIKNLGKVICLSFHPKEHDLNYPYL